MTTISSQSAIQAYSLPLGKAAQDTASGNSTAVSADAQAASSATSADDAVAAAISASANSSSYTFAQVAKNARTALDANIKTLGKTPDDSTTGAQWGQVFGSMDRRSMYAVSSNQGGQFSTAEQQAAGFFLTKQIGDAGLNPSANTPAEHMKVSQSQIDVLNSASPEEKQSPGWAMNMAAATTSYNLEASDAGQPPQDATYTDPLVKVLMAAMKSAQSDPSKDRTVGQESTLAEIKAQPWAQGFGDQIDAAYAASRPQGGLVNVQA
jgi:hypothetical protein